MACPILVVEDDPELREMMATLLSVEGYDPKTASNGREALEHLRGGFTPNVILLDLMMPVMNGWQFRAEQQGDPELANIPVVIVTALAVNHREALGAELVLTKPLDFDRLLSVVRAHC